MEAPTPTIASEIDHSYTQSVNAQTVASIYIINPRGPIKDVYMELHGWFLKLFLYTASVPEVSTRIGDGLREQIEEWFQQTCSQNSLLTGIQLHRDYISILQDTGTILIRRG